MKNLYKNFSLLLPIIFLLQPVILNSQSNQYLHFDKEDDYVILNEGGQFINGSSELSMTGWFKCDALGYGQGYMGFRSGSGNGEFYLIQLGDGKMECRLKTTTLFSYEAPVNTIIPQVWQHWAWIYDGSNLSLYVNGTYIGGIAASGQFSSTTVPFAIGKSTLSGYNFVYGGGIDEVSVWNKALSQIEIQDIMADELTGNEDNLQLYYKFDQGDPGGNNTSITHLVCEIGSGDRDAELMNFALTGETSNFVGTLNPGYQAISFPQIPNHLTTDPPFDIEASATSGLDVFFEVISGPATIDGNTITLTGDAGEVEIEASQPGNAQFEPAEPVVNTFQVLDPNTHVPIINPRNPLSGDVYVPTLSAIQLSTISTIEYSELFYVQGVQFEINSETVAATNYYNGHFVGWWTPPAYGPYSITITSTTNFGASSSETININIVETVSDMEVLAFEGVWLNPTTQSMIVESELLSYMGAFDQINAILDVQCPFNNCDDWDRIAHVYATDHRGQRIEIIRYITPYGVPCSHNIDLTDYMSFLQGKIKFEVACGTYEDYGFEFSLTLNYSAGTPVYAYSSVDTIWQQTFQFGDYANLQPVPEVHFTFPDEAVASKLKLVGTGHGWDINYNTSNAAEFYEATHTIWVNGEQTFDQHNWYDCQPNPDGCQPQNGSWTHDRAGWCPGAIAQWFDYDLTPYMGSGEIDLDYVFFPDYVDYCHPNHPDCITGTTCANCDQGFNPHLVVACNLVSFSEIPLITTMEDHLDFSCELIPNPTKGHVELTLTGPGSIGSKTIEVYDATGSLVKVMESMENVIPIDLSNCPSGLYFVKLDIGGKIEIKKIVVW